MSSQFDAEFLGRETCGTDVVTTRFSRPAGFSFVAGQWMLLSLLMGDERLTETFTICSAPSDDYLEITTRLTGSAFKTALTGLVSGDCVQVAGPSGRLELPRDFARVGFLVGGVGITPVRSMLREAVAAGRVFQDALLVYANRDASCVPFLGEFALMASNGVRMVLCYEEPSQDWTGESGLITAEMVRRYLRPGEDDRTFIATGPPQMVGAMERVLDELGVPTERRIIERFGSKPS